MIAAAFLLCMFSIISAITCFSRGFITAGFISVGCAALFFLVMMVLADKKRIESEDENSSSNPDVE